MRVHPLRFLPLFASLCFAAGNATAQDALKVVDEGKTRAVVAVDAKAGKWEKQAAADLVKYVERMTGTKPALADTDAAATAALKTDAPLLIVGAAA